MARLVYGLSQSPDGHVDHMELGPPVPAAFGHFIGQVRGVAGLLYGRRTNEIMRYWKEDLPDWDAEDRDFATAGRNQPTWVVSSSLKSAGPNGTLVEDGLIDEYRLYLRPVVLGGGEPFFAGPRPPLHLVASDIIADDLIRLTYVSA